MTKGGQKLKLLRAMQNGVRLTIYNAMVDYGCGALHQRIGELKQDGWPILRGMRRVGTTTVAEFYMDREESLHGERDNYPLRAASWE